MVSTNLSIRREAIFTLGNVLIGLEGTRVHDLVTSSDFAINDFFKGLTILTSYDLLLSLLPVIEYFIEIDLRYDSQSLKRVFLQAGGIDYLEQLQDS